MVTWAPFSKIYTFLANLRVFLPIFGGFTCISADFRRIYAYFRRFLADLSVLLPICGGFLVFLPIFGHLKIK